MKPSAMQVRCLTSCWTRITFWQPIFMLLYEVSREVAVISSHFNMKTSV